MFAAISQDNMELGIKGDVDILQNNYSNYFKKFGINLIPITNGSDVDEYFNNIKIKAIILTGGTDIGKRKIRDETEKKLMNIAIKKDIPLLGICRGIQFINNYFSGNFINIKEEIKNNVGHIATTHEVSFFGDAQKFFGKNKTLVNSFHNNGINEKTLSKELKVFAISEKDKIIEGIFHPKYSIAGIEWHPERKSPDEKINEKIIKAFINKELFWK